jgi:hypothetical protein
MKRLLVVVCSVLTILTFAQIAPVQAALASELNGSLSQKVSAANILNQTDPTKGASLVGFKPSGTGTVATTVAAALGYGFVPVFNYLSAAQVADVTARTQTQDITAAAQAAINAFPGGFVTIFFPAGTYKITSSLVIPSTVTGIRITGAGMGTILSMSGKTSFDLISWSNPGDSGVGVNHTQIDNIALNGNGLSGTGNLINTTHISSIRLNDLFLTQIPINGSGIYVNGYGTTYSHDIRIDAIYVDTTTGFAFVNFGSLSADSMLRSIYGNGRFGCQYGLYFAAGSANIIVTDGHPYNVKKNVLSVNRNNDTIEFNNFIFDFALLDTVALNGAANLIFNNCKFYAAGSSSYSTLALNDTTNSKFNSPTFMGYNGDTNSKYAINETGASNGNIFNQVTNEGGFTPRPYNLQGVDSAVRVQGVDRIIDGNAVGLTGTTTVYAGLGMSSATPGNVQSLSVYPGLIRKIIVRLTIAPEAGFLTATVRLNGVNTTIRVTLKGASTYLGIGTGAVATVEGDVIDVVITTSLGGLVTTAHTSVVVNE